jgi:type IV fimbrial biogenesis protein FimT
VLKGRSIRRDQPGFTLIELVVVFALTAILVTLAVPAFQLWIQNSAIRSTADGLQNGLRAASAEAVRRSSQVTFVLSQSPGAFNGAASPTGTYWYIQAVPTLTSQTATAQDLVQVSPQGFGSNGTLISATSSNGAVSAICFNSLGRQITNTGVGGTKVTGKTGTRPLWVIASLGGKVRMCDPSKPYNSSNPDGCY